MLKDGKADILLESGTNEIEVMKFTINDSLYGINIAKVTEILVAEPVKSMFHSHAAVEGIFKSRGVIRTVVDLPKYLTGIEVEKNPKDLFIITEFNKLNLAFRVHTVVGISRIFWSDIQKTDQTVSGGDGGVATGIAKCGSDMITLLDFEKIMAEIAPSTTFQMTEIDRLGYRDRKNTTIVVAEDSVLLRKLLETALHKAGYINTRMFPNGQDLWNFLCEVRGSDHRDDMVDLIITDIEMPQMGGHHLTKLIKEDEDFQHIPLIIFSSMITAEMRSRGKELGADEQLSKPEIGHLIQVIDRLLADRKRPYKQR